MIDKLKKRIILLATASMFVLMAILVTVMNLVNYFSLVRESDTVLEMLSQPGFPGLDDIEPPEGQGENPTDQKEPKDFVPRGMSEEVPYESRYFSVKVNEAGEIVSSDLSKIVSVDQALMVQYANAAMSKKAQKGFIDRFRFAKSTEGGITTVTFLDCGRKLDAFETFLFSAICVGIGGCLIVFVAFLLLAGKIVRPIAESYEKQKRFISDAGHEIKTPLTIINANVDLLESDGEKEELTEIRSQTKRLTELTKNLVYLSKMEEREKSIEKIECPISDIVSETGNSFRAPAMAKNISLSQDVEPELCVCASPDALRQLVSILMENAVKYTPDGGNITLRMKKAKKTLSLSVSNTSAEAIPQEVLPRLFDRFYRTDASRNSATGGHGIGLSVAKAITDAHGGTISASYTEDGTFTISASIPC